MDTRKNYPPRAWKVDTGRGHNGVFRTVSISERGVAHFASRWPCFGTVRKLAFEIDARNGDLVDIHGKHDDIDDRAMLALTMDAGLILRDVLRREERALQARLARKGIL